MDSQYNLNIVTKARFRNVHYNIFSFRKLTQSECARVIAGYIRTQKPKRLPANSVINILSIHGFDE